MQRVIPWVGNGVVVKAGLLIVLLGLAPPSAYADVEAGEKKAPRRLAP